MKSLDKSWSNRVDRLIMSFAFMVLMFLGTSPLNAAGSLQINPGGCKGEEINGYTQTPSDTGEVLYTCLDASYTPGNIQGNWFELDLVPFKLEIVNNTGAGISQIGAGGLYKKKPDATVAWDYISEFTLYDTASSPGCPKTDISVFATDILPSGQSTELRRSVTLDGDIADGDTCVYHYNMRLAIGSAEYQGSTIHAYQIVGNGTKTIPNNSTVFPLTVSKNMSAVQSGSRAWEIVKSADEDIIDFGDTCKDGVALARDVNITVTWTRGEPTFDGKVKVTTTIKASNGASRDLNVTVVDTLFDVNDTQIGQPHQCDPFNLPPHVGETVVCQFDVNIDASFGDVLKDTAVVTYIDPDFPNLVNIDKIAHDDTSVQGSDDELKDDNATIVDNEYITGTSLKYSVESVSGDSAGSFDAYSLKETTTADINWTSGLLTGSGSVVFHKRIHIDSPAIKVNGSLGDMAKLEGSNGFMVEDTLTAIPIDSDPRVSFKITKTMPAPHEAVTFTFNIKNQNGYDKNVTIEMAEDVESNFVIIEDRYPDTYNILELPVVGFKVDGPTSQQLNLSRTCSGAVTFDNIKADRPSVKVKKVTYPSGYEGDWNMTLYKQNGDQWDVVNSILTPGASFGELVAADMLLGGTYKIEELLQDGWYKTGAAGCEFTYVVDANVSPFECIYANKYYSEIVIKKVVEGQDGSFTFTQNINDSGTFNLSNDGSKTFANLKTREGFYTVTEDDPRPDYDLVDIDCVEIALLDQIFEENGVLSINSFDERGQRKAEIALREGMRVECTFTNRERGKISVNKTISGQVTPVEWTFTLEGDGLYERNVSDGTLTFDDTRLIPGKTYTLCERYLDENITATWTLNGDPVTPSRDAHDGHFDMCYDFNVSVGETAEFVIDNKKSGMIIINKVVEGESSDTFNFTQNIEEGSLVLADGETKMYMKVAAGSYTVTEIDPIPGFDLVSIECSESGALIPGLELNTVWDLEQATASIEVDDGETVECTFTNRERGVISVSKTISGVPSPVGWTFILKDAEGIIGTGEVSNSAYTFNDTKLIPGEPYTLCERYERESITADWSLNGSAVTPTITQGEGYFEMCYAFSVNADEEANFEIDNHIPATVIIDLIVIGGSDQIFDFSQDIPDVSSLTLGDGISRTFSSVPTGTYDISLPDLQGFNFISVVCVERDALLGLLDNSEINLADRLASIQLDDGETVACTFTIKKDEVEDEVQVRAAVHLGDFAWYDDDNNGIQDLIDPVKGLKVELLDGNGNPVADANGVSVQYTDAAGRYDFLVNPGVYKVRFSGIPSNYVFSQRNAGGDANKDSNADANGVTGAITISGASDISVDVGIFCTTLDRLSGGSSGSSSGGSAYSTISVILMGLMTIMMALFFIRKEEFDHDTL